MTGTFVDGGRMRSRSPKGAAIAATWMPKGSAVQYFHIADAAKSDAELLQPQAPQNGKVSDWAADQGGPRLLQSHGWLEGVLMEAFDGSSFDPEQQDTWPLVAPRPSLTFVDKSGKKRSKATQPRRVMRIRELSKQPPALSLVFVRWGGTYSAWMDEQESNDGDWGKYGSPPSDEYMAALADIGVLRHPRLGGDACDVEIFSLFVASSRDCYEIIPMAPWLASVLKGKKRTCFWMLWPAEWEDTEDPDFACYVERHAIFSAMRACEAAKLRSGFPHPADQFELITSKAWMATLCTHPAVHLPACTLVSKHSVVSDLPGAARQAIAALEHIRRVSPFPAGPGEPPTLSSANKEMMTQPGLASSQCIVQEWVDFDFEMRFYFLPPADWEPGAFLEPERIECNEWGERNEEKCTRRGSSNGPSTLGTCHASFHKLKKEEILLHRWKQDEDAWRSATEQATEVSQLLLAWLRTVNAEPVPMIRLDFMVRRLGPGKARVVFGEFCEMGACCLGWQEGPPTIWRAALDAALR
eukprot:gnl/TRDRNA2_/TRDRNA2_168467_c0_seq5.p1 gnl/TRDRNA2_/TRDRNA2_168467_c0~~gnl/TRDRNA2_/TRDRNA2_168467_c0_seq5.p1  ORF type:complete len:540 (-),score=102.64 gnl/TRDRNA2_/TRDRNA2_168467_c0_seq5:105-1682(-)